jgi:tetratricopeptide (TPR) repeat protein
LEQVFADHDHMDLAAGALIASGVSDAGQLECYRAKVDRMCQAIAPASAADDVERARQVFHWLWRSKPHRYERGGNFRLGDVIDAQIGQSEAVGNCLGLTILYNVLARRLGLEVKAIYLDDAFGIGPHVLTLLRTGERSIDVENMLPHGFDYAGHRDSPRRRQWDNRELVADVYHSMGNRFFHRGELEKAIRSYDEAIRLSPGYATPRFNKGIALVELGEIDQAMRWLK